MPIQRPAYGDFLVCRFSCCPFGPLLNPALQVFSHLQEVPRGWLPSKLLQYCFARVLAACWLRAG